MNYDLNCKRNWASDFTIKISRNKTSKYKIGFPSSNRWRRFQDAIRPLPQESHTSHLPNSFKLFFFCICYFSLLPEPFDTRRHILFLSPWKFWTNHRASKYISREQRLKLNLGFHFSPLLLSHSILHILPSQHSLTHFSVSWVLLLFLLKNNLKPQT